MADNTQQNWLFKEEKVPELAGASYYAYLDSVERIDHKYFIRFDCIDVTKALQTEITSETILDFPSIVIEFSDNENALDKLFGNENPYDIESNWMLIKTEFGNTEQTVDQLFNFVNQTTDSRGNYGITSITTPQNLVPLDTNKVSELERATLLNESPVADVHTFLTDPGFTGIDHINVYDVGQGNCNGLTDANNVVRAYFDLGGGCNANKFTYPAGITICVCQTPPVILSHWDQDHIEIALHNPQTWLLKWLVPVQKLSNTAYHLANRLLQNGNLTCWNSSIPIPHNFSGHYIVKCTGAITNKNNSGLALFVEYLPNEYAFLTGDARFGAIPLITVGQVTALVASHHGANGSVVAPTHTPPQAAGNSMLAYSYGERNGTKNTHGHSHTQAEADYQAANWGPAKRAMNGHIALKRSPLTLTTPCNRNCSLQISIGQHY